MVVVPWGGGGGGGGGGRRRQSPPFPKYGPAKRGIKSPIYRNLQVHPRDRPLFNRDAVESVDTALPFGLRPAPLIFTVESDTLTWIVKSRGVRSIQNLSLPNDHNVTITDETCKETGLQVEVHGKE